MFRAKVLLNVFFGHFWVGIVFGRGQKKPQPGVGAWYVSVLNLETNRQT